MNRDYWLNRLADKLYDKQSKEMKKELRKYYKQAMKDIKYELQELYIKLIEDGELSTTNLYKYGRYNALQMELEKIIRGLGGREQVYLNTELEKSYMQMFEDTSMYLDGSINWGIQQKEVMEQLINANFKGADFKTRINTNKERLLKNLNKEIVNCIASGVPKDRAIKQIMNVTGASFNDADRLMRTELMRCINYGQVESYKEHGYTQFKVLVGKDERTCEVCNGKQGRVYNFMLDELPPFHPRCRCTIIPIINR